MAYMITYDNHGGVITSYSGIITDNDIFECLEERTSSKDTIKSYKYFISDFTDVSEFKVTTSGVQRVADTAIGLSKLNPNLIFVAIVSSYLEYGMLRMWQTYSAETNWKTNIARNEHEAYEWIEKNL